MANEFWQPSAEIKTLQARAELLRDIRAFFAQQGVLEVETPILSSFSNTDPKLPPIRAVHQATPGATAQEMYCQTSPEFAMKRLLAAGSGAIYQICKVFRSGESGQRHNPEFTMLEWYRPDYDEHQLMDELETLLRKLLGYGTFERLSYQKLFESSLGINPHRSTVSELAALATAELDIELPDQGLGRDAWLDLLFSHVIEPQLKQAHFIYDYPASQAALAKVETNADGIEVARRFELVIKGMEIANGYKELTDVAEQKRRFLLEQELSSDKRPCDENLLAALEHGMPECAGVALGLDRLLMLRTGLDSIAAVLAFPFERA